MFDAPGAGRPGHGRLHGYRPAPRRRPGRARCSGRRSGPHGAAAGRGDGRGHAGHRCPHAGRGCRVTDRAAVDRAAAWVADELGRVDLLVNNAGVIDAAEVPVWEADPDQWWSVVTSHIRGAQLLVRAVVPGMLARGHGRVVNLASGMSIRANRDYSAYSVAKTGLMRLTEALTLSLQGSGLHAFDVAPGVVDTPMTRSMDMWRGFGDWTAPERGVAIVAAIAGGGLGAWSGRFLRAGTDDVDTLRRLTPEGAARQLRLRPYGRDDSLTLD